jgi:prephenate dehydrogenase
LHPAAPKKQTALCATGFRDVTRIASGSPEMWRDIALANRKNISRSVDAYIAALRQFQSALKTGDAPALENFFATAKSRRDHWCAGCASPSPE